MFNKIAFDLAPNGVATVMLNRPHASNAITQSMLEDFDNLWKRVRMDDAIRVVVIHGHPDARGFSSGADVRGGDDGGDGIARDANVFVNRSVAEYLCPRLYGVWKPVITAVHGICAGAGLFLVNDSDIVLCSQDAQFFDPHLSIGIASAIGPIGMTRRVNLGEVLRYALLSNAERLGAETALRVGLVTEVLPRADLLARAQRLAAIVADYDSVAVQGTLKAIWESLELGRKAAIERAPLYSDAARASSGHSLAEATTAARSHWTR